MDKRQMARKMSSKKAEIYIIRHGSTKLNSEDKIRGWLDLPLDDKGKKEAEKMGMELTDEGLYGLVSSDLLRAEQTAEVVSKEAEIPILATSPAFRPWNVGVHQGKLAEEVLPEMEAYARKKPNTPIPEGESFNRFKERFLNGVEQVQRKYPGKKIGIVTHHRGDRIMAAWEMCGMKGREVDLDTMFEKGIEPGDWRKQGQKLQTNKKPD